jgi:hypothetical protein
MKLPLCTKNCNTLQSALFARKACRTRPADRALRFCCGVVRSGRFGPSPNSHSVRSYLVSFDDVDVKRSEAVTYISVACEVDRLELLG